MYAWNSAPIKGTDILHIIPPIGRELHFLLDINLNAVPKLTQTNARAVLEYLHRTNSSRHLSSSIPNIHMKDRRTAYVERINNSRNLVVLHAGDIVMARTAIQSDHFKNKVTRLSYSIQCSYQIIRNTWFDSYFVRKFDKPDSPELKFMAYDLYPLPSSLQPREPIDTINTSYLN